MDDPVTEKNLENGHDESVQKKGYVEPEISEAVELPSASAQNNFFTPADVIKK